MSWISSESRRSTFLSMLSPRPGEKILDVGAGKGAIASVVQNAGKSEVYALDPNKKRVAFIEKNHPNLKGSVGDADKVPFPDGFFDKVYSTMAVHHYHDQRRSFKELARVLKPGGLLVVADLIPSSSMARLGRFIANVILRLHLKFLTPEI